MMETEKSQRSATILFALLVIVCIVPVPQVLASGGSWSAKASMPTARGYAGSAVVNEKIYVIGGLTNNWEAGFHPLNTTEAYDPGTNLWTSLSPMPTPRCHLAAAEVNGKVYAIGGFRSDGTNALLQGDNEVYDPATDIWSVSTPMPTHRAALSASAVDGKIYAIGGVSASGQPCNVTEVFNPAANSWTTAADLPISVSGHGAAVLEGMICVVGGKNSSGEVMHEVQACNPGSDTWSLKAELPTGRIYPAVASTNGVNASACLFVTGGYTIGPFPPTAQIGTNEAYDPGTNTWSVLTLMPT